MISRQHVNSTCACTIFTIGIQEPFVHCKLLYGLMRLQSIWSRMEVIGNTNTTRKRDSKLRQHNGKKRTEKGTSTASDEFSDNELKSLCQIKYGKV